MPLILQGAVAVAGIRQKSLAFRAGRQAQSLMEQLLYPREVLSVHINAVKESVPDWCKLCHFMEAADSGDITILLESWRAGQRSGLDDLLGQAYPCLHRLADNFLVRESSDNTLQATELVNELYIFLRRQRDVSFANRTEFYSFAAYLIRLMLRTRARDRKTHKRGAGQVRIPLCESLSWIDAAGPEILDVNRALDELEVLHERKARLIELTAFLGLSSADAAELLGVSKATADRDLRFTRAWLRDRLRADVPSTTSWAPGD